MARDQVKQMRVLVDVATKNRNYLSWERMEVVSHEVLVLGQTIEKPLTVIVQVEGKSFRMEIDTGASVSIISQNTWKFKFPG